MIIALKFFNLENDGKELLEILYSYRDHISALREVFQKVRTDLDEDVVLLIDDLFPAIEKEINEIIIIVERLVSEERINNLLGSIELITNVEVVDYDTTFYKLKKYYDQDLPKRIQKFDAGNASQYAAAFSNEIDTVLDVYQKLPALSDKLKNKEQSEFASVEKILQREMQELSDLTELSSEISSRLDDIGRVMTDEGLNQTKNRRKSSNKADYGIINVFYERREEINQEKERLISEKKLAQQQVQETMDYINSKLATYDIDTSDDSNDSSE